MYGKNTGQCVKIFLTVHRAMGLKVGSGDPERSVKHSQGMKTHSTIIKFITLLLSSNSY